MRVLIACEFSGVVREEFLKRGHDAYSCDLLPSVYLKASEGRHLQQDVIPLLRERWDLIIAHPPCTYLANSGVRFLKLDPMRIVKVREATAFFLEFVKAACPRVCVENSIHHKYARELIGYPTQRIQPWQFGHGESKTTCLWLKGLPQLRPTKIVAGREQ